MARIEINLVINRPVEEVFAFVSNSENLPRWRSTSLEVKKTSEGAIGVGSTFFAKLPRTVTARTADMTSSEAHVE